MTDRVLFVGTPEGFVRLEGMVQRWREDPRNAAMLKVWAVQQSTIANEVDANVKSIVGGQDPSDDVYNRSRPFEVFAVLGEGPGVQKTPPVVLHAPPRLRGRWGRG